MAETILGLKQDINALKLIPSGGGAFEVSVDGEKIYSKLQTGEFPKPEAILAAVRERL